MPVYSGDPNEAQYIVAYDVYRALSSYNKCDPPPISEEQRARLFQIQQLYPQFEYDNTLFTVSYNSSRDEYIDYMIMLRYRYNRLINDPSVDLIEISHEILGLCAIIEDEYSEHIPPRGATYVDDKETTDRNPFKPDRSIRLDVKNIKRATEITSSNNLFDNTCIRGGELNHDEDKTLEP